MILETNATNGLSNQDHEAQKVLPTARNVILLEVFPPFQIAKKGVEWVKKGLNHVAKLENARNLMLQNSYELHT